MQHITHNLRSPAIFILLLVVMFLVVGHVAYAQGPDPSVGGFVPCGRDFDNSGSLEDDEQCDFNDLVALANNIVQWLVFISVFIAAGTFTYAGYLYVTSAGNEEGVKKAHEIFRVTVIGFLIVLAAWLIVYTIGAAVVGDTNILLLG